ncbi:MAG: PAS domain S-box protein [Myxococcales bacterium]|nr:PAS domain S-box protein [Myxococcales bacterium]
MKSAPLPPNEEARLAALAATQLLDTPPEPAFDDATKLAAAICGTPIALVSLVAEDRQWFKARVGLDATETRREISFCAHALLGSELFVVPDARADPRFADNPLVCSTPNARFYAGAPLVTPGGQALGTLCVIDVEPRVLLPWQEAALGILARQVVAQIELRMAVAEAERRNAELRRASLRVPAALRHVEDILDAANFSIISTEPDGTIRSFNRTAERLLGYSAAEVVGKVSPALIHDPREVVDRAAALSRELGRPIEPGFEVFVAKARLGMADESEWTYVRKDGSRFPVLLSVTAIRDGDGALTAFLGVAADLTAKRAAEEAAHETASRLRSVLDTAVDAIITIDAAGLVESFNLAAERLFGYPAAEVLGRNVSLLMPEPYHSEHDGYLARYLRTGERRIIGIGREVVGQHKDGTTFPMELAVSEVRANHRRLFTGIVRDISARKAAEAELRAKNTELAAQTRLAQAASRLKSEFLANMSHELRTPLNGIIGFTQLLHQEEVGPISPEQKEFLGDVLRSGQHLLQLINDVLDLSKVEAGKLEFRPELIDPTKVAGEVRDIVRSIAASKRIRIELDIDPTLGAIVTDPSKMKQVLYNYLSNALKFTPEEGRVTVSIQSEPGEQFRIEVEDTGIGIAPSDLGRLFVEFQQLDAGAAKLHQGTGLGLALTQRLVEAQGGRVGVRSTLGQGSVFFAVLPTTPPGTTLPIEPPPASPAAPNPVAATPRGAGPGAILVVEDDPKERAWLRRTLGQAGYEVEVAATGAEAIAYARDRAFAAVTLDLFLPDMTGWDVLRALRASGPNREVPVIVVTVVEDRSAAVGFKIHDFLTKPGRGEDLAAALEHAGVLPGGSRTVLVIDDDPGAAQIAASALGAKGFRAVIASEGESGLRIAASEHPAAVILDLSMPGMDGFEFLRRFRRVPEGARTPVIVWSGKDLTADERVRLQAAAQAVVLKGAGASTALIDELGAQIKEATWRANRS